VAGGFEVGVGAAGGRGVGAAGGFCASVSGATSASASAGIKEIRMRWQANPLAETKDLMRRSLGRTFAEVKARESSV